MISGGVFSLILMPGCLLIKNKQSIHYITALVYFCHASIVINKGLACSGIVLRYPFFMHWDLFTFYLVSPAIFLYLRAYIDPDFSFKKRYLLNLIPFVLVLLLYIPFFLKPAEEKAALFPYYIFVEPGPLRPFIAASYIVPSLMIFLYIILGLRQFSVKASLKVLTGSWPSRIILFLLCENMILACLMISAYFFWNYTIYRLIMLCLNQVVVCFFLIDQRYPGFYEHSEKREPEQPIRQHASECSEYRSVDYTYHGIHESRGNI